MDRTPLEAALRMAGYVAAGAGLLTAVLAFQSGIAGLPLWGAAASAAVAGMLLLAVSDGLGYLRRIAGAPPPKPVAHEPAARPVRCPACRAANPAGAAFCRGCGEPMGAAA